MSINSAMNAAVTALQAQGQNLNMISNNLANTSTIGYKAVSASFTTLMASNATADYYPSGGVISSARQNVYSEGNITSSSVATDMAIQGNGMFVVTKANSSSTTPYFTRDGEFSTDKSGNLVSANGDYYLMGWPTDTSGNVPATVDTSTSSGLEKINLANFSSNAAATSTASMEANLPADASAGQTFTKSIEVYDSLGAPQTLPLTFTAPNPSGTPSTQSGVWTVTVGVPVNPTDSSTTTASSVAVTANGTTTAASTTATYYVAFDSAGNLVGTYSSAALAEGATGTAATATSAGTAGTGVLGANQALSTYNAAKTQLTTDEANSATTAATLATDETYVSNAYSTLQGVETGKSQSVSIAINGWNDGSSNSSVTFSMGSSGTTNGFTQYASGTTSPQMSVTSSSANGVAYGQEQSVSIGSDGTVTVQYSNGQSVPVAKVALATFTDINGLSAESGNVYAMTQTSGNYSLTTAGQNGTGTIAGSSLEDSNVDTSTEFTQMITAQQAYSAASQIISTGKSMFQTLLQSVGG